jgi:hypothetical protein
MKRVLLFCGGLLLALVAETILWHSADLFTFEDGWLKELTWIADLGLIAQGAVAAAGAALCFARAFVPINPAAQNRANLPGPVVAAVWQRPLLPICGILFLLAAVRAFYAANNDFDTLHVMESFGGYGASLIEDWRLHGWAALAFCIGYSILGGALLVAPMLLRSRGWQLGQRINGVGCGMALGGLLLSGMSVFVWFANGLAMEGRSEGLSAVCCFGILGGTALAVVGSIVAVFGRKSNLGEGP